MNPSPVTPDFSSRLSALRSELKRRGLDGFFVPMTDEYQSEYVAASARRIEFLSGFTGSAGLIVVLKDNAAFFTDSRYTLQASRQVPYSLFNLNDSAVTTSTDWLKGKTWKGMKLGFDPWLHTADNIERYEKSLAESGVVLVAVDKNPVDAVWRERPEYQTAKILSHDVIYAGKSSAEKRREIADKIKQKDVNAAVITDPASIAWLLNIRGQDVPHTPLPLCYAIIRTNAFVELFVDLGKTSAELVAHLGSEVNCLDATTFSAGLKRLGETRSKILIDKSEAAHWIVVKLRENGCKIDFSDNPCLLPKACKNPTEVEGMRAAHRRDGAALVKLLAWLDKNAPMGNVTEIMVEKKLAEFRAEKDFYCGPSFDTIAGSGPNGAIVHYRATEETNRTLEMNSLLLLDSGGQYLDGTTDVTRTVVIGNPSSEMRDRFTRVLKGHIALANIRFPEDTNGSHLDILARQYLWAAGLDYSHGTGHGVGSYLGVHEGPQSISRRGFTTFKSGMVLSNEPGYYKTSHYGIRIENLQVVMEMPETSGQERKMLGFETLTLAPIDLKNVVVDMLTVAEKDWLNTYHSRIKAALRPQLDDETYEWLEETARQI